MSDTFALILAQATAPVGPASPAAPPDSNASGGSGLLYMFPVLMALLYFAFIRPQSQAKKKQEEQIKTAKTGDRIVTTSGIHGFISNVKDTTVIVKVADNVKLEIEKSHIDKVLRADSADAEKVVVTKS